LLDPSVARALVDRFVDAGYTVDGIHAALGPAGAAALARADLAAVDRATRDRDPLSTLTRLFILGRPVAVKALREAISDDGMSALATAGIVETRSGGVEAIARLDIRPYAEDTSNGFGRLYAQAPDPHTPDAHWWVISDFAVEVRPGPLPSDHVLGIGAAATTLAQAVVRKPVLRALDLGTGCGIQALHLGRHAGQVVATDISERALTLAATTAALNALDWDLRSGDLLAPVSSEQFDLIVANPPFVVGPARRGAAGHDYRDSGRAGDDVSRELVRNLPARLTPGGIAQFLANWEITAEQGWTER
jgi:methylase of polypeptide subunit release factors